MTAQTHPTQTRMPPGWRLAVLAAVALALAGALALLTVRGPAMLIDLAQAAWAMLCL